MSYKVVDLRGIVGSNPNGLWDTSTKHYGAVVHYNGPPTPAWAWNDPVEWIKVIVRGHMQRGRFAPGWLLGTCAYHEFVFNDTVYRINNYGAMLPHCGNTVWNRESLGIHVAIGQGQRASKQTIATVMERTQDHLDAIGAGRSGFKGHKEVGSSACPGSLMEDLVLPFRVGKNVEPEPPTPPKASGKVRKVIWALNADSDGWHEKVARASAKAMRTVGVRSHVSRHNLASVKRAYAKDGIYCVVVGEDAAKGVEDRLPNIMARDALDEKGVILLADGNIRNESRWRIADLCDMGGLDEEKALATHMEAMDDKPKKEPKLSTVEKAVKFGERMVSAGIDYGPGWKAGTWPLGSSLYSRPEKYSDDYALSRDVICSGLTNLCRHRATGKSSPGIAEGDSYPGGTAAYGRVFSGKSGVERYNPNKTYPRGWLFISKYLGPALSHQGHVMISLGNDRIIESVSTHGPIKSRTDGQAHRSLIAACGNGINWAVPPNIWLV